MQVQDTKLDEELRRILDMAAEMTPIAKELQLQQTQSPAWPWQVQQVPSYTSDHVPNPK